MIHPKAKNILALFLLSVMLFNASGVIYAAVCLTNSACCSEEMENEHEGMLAEMPSENSCCTCEHEDGLSCMDAPIQPVDELPAFLVKSAVKKIIELEETVQDDLVPQASESIHTTPPELHKEHTKIYLRLSTFLN